MDKRAKWMVLGVAGAGAVTLAFVVARKRYAPDLGPARIEGHVPLDETSGMVVGNDGILWMHNDSGADAILYAVSPAGEVLGAVEVIGAGSRDWEDLARGRCGRGNCLYVADIGDNARRRDRVTIYRLTEPDVRDGQVQAERMDLVYPDGPVNAEALFVDDSTLHLLTKESGTTRHMRAEFQPGEGVWEHIQTIDLPASRSELVTGADFHSRLRRVLVRTYGHVYEYHLRRDGLLGESRELPVEEERQGETIAYSHRGDRYWHVSEGEGSPIWSHPRR